MQGGQIIECRGLTGGQLLNLIFFVKSEKMGMLQKRPPTGEKSMGKWENGVFYTKVHAQGKCQWETGKMAYFTQRSMCRGKAMGNWENKAFDGKVHPQGKCRRETGKMPCVTQFHFIVSPVGGPFHKTSHFCSFPSTLPLWEDFSLKHAIFPVSHRLFLCGRTFP